MSNNGVMYSELQSQFRSVSWKEFLGRLLDLQQFQKDVDMLERKVATACKDDLTALQDKEDGNTAFRKGDLDTAIQSFTKALLWCAADDTKAILFCNRAAALQKRHDFKLAIADCTRALGIDPTYVKAWQRRAQCWTALGKAAAAAADMAASIDASARTLSLDILACEPPRSSPERPLRLNPYLQHASCKVQLACDELQGRHIIACEPVHAGEVLVTESALVAFLLPRWTTARCSWCLQDSSNLIPCLDCSQEMYCSLECQSRAQTQYHHIECRSDSLVNLLPTVRLALRLAVSASCATAQTDVEAVVDASETVAGCLCVPTPNIRGCSSDGIFGSDYRAVTSLDHHLDERPPAFGDFVQYAVQAQVAAKIAAGHGVDVTAEEIFVHINRLRTNVYAVTALLNDKITDSVTQEKIALAVYPTCSMLNHSCRPNTILQYGGRSLTIRASEDISTGSAVMNCYGPHAGHMSSQTRREILQEQYFFDCRCTACERPDDAREANLRCPVDSCTGLLTRVSNSQLNCINCSAVYSADKMQSELKLATDFLTRARHELEVSDNVETIDRCIEMLLRARAMRRALLHQNDRQIALVENVLSQAYNRIGMHEKSWSHFFCSLNILEHHFRPSDVEMGYEYTKAAQLCLNCGEPRRQQARHYVERAKVVFSCTLGSGHPVMEELGLLAELC